MPKWWWYRISLTRPRPQIVRHMHMFANNSDNGHQASAKAVCVVKLFSMADSRTERLRCTTASIYQSSLYRSYVPYPAVIDVCRLSKLPRIVATQKCTRSSWVAVLSDQEIRYRSFSWKLFLTVLCCHKVGTTERLHSWCCGKLDQPKIN